MTKDNVIVGPWEKSSKNVPEKTPEQKLKEEKMKMEGDMAFIDEMTESLVVQMIHTMSENEIDIGSKNFIRDVAFITECIKCLLFRELGYEHPLQNLIKKLFEIKVDNKQMFTKFRADILLKILGDIKK